MLRKVKKENKRNAQMKHYDKNKSPSKYHLVCFVLAIYSWTWDLDLRSCNLSET